MAGLIEFPQRSVRILDPGAGSGILSAAVCERVLQLRTKRHIHLELYETDASLLPSLIKCLNECRRVLRSAGHDLVYSLNAEDFIFAASAQPSLFAHARNRDGFDAVIMNPPYFKIGRDSPHSRAMAKVVHGLPNIYALFLALSADLLRPGGQLVAITPRSFCNGLYFRGFRRWFFQRMSLDHVHLFESRRDTFRDAKVLQESVITRTTKQNQASRIRLTTSFGRDIPLRPARRALPPAHVLDNSTGDMVLRIPVGPNDSQVMKLVESWPKRFAELGLRVSTGPVVSFRAIAFLRQEMNGANTVPLLSVHNVRAFETLWPLDKGRKPKAFAVQRESKSLLLPARNYVLLRRFTAKEECRRLVASTFLRSQAPRDQIALENHLNYVYHAKRDLSEKECLGLAALFNSALLDRYFRTISGNTQVNATELRSMPLPDLRLVSRIGAKIQKHTPITRALAEAVVLSELRVSKPLKRFLEGRPH
jgi:adenine-specific DNA-methyltransferase